MLSLSLTVLENNDASALTFTDATGTTGTGGWGQSGNINPSDIDGNTHTLTMQLTHKTVAGETVYNTIDLYTAFGPFTTVDDLVFEITPDMLIDSNSESPDSILDGIYEVTYIVDEDLGTEVVLNMTIFAYSLIRNNVYDRLRQIPQIYNSTDSRSKEIDDTLFMYAFLKAMEASAYVALEDELMNDLDATEKLYLNGSNYTWK